MVRLRAIARFWGVELTTSRHRDVADGLGQEMVTPEAITSAWDTLPDIQRQALEALLASEGRMPLRVFARQWGEIRTMGPGRTEREQPWREPVSPAEGLWYTGFIARAFEQGPEGSYEVVFIPPELQAGLPAPSVSPPAITLDPAPEPAVVRSASDALLDDACEYLAYVQNEPLRPSPEGNWPARHETRLVHRLRDPNPERLRFLRHLARHLGWLRVIDSGRLRPDPGPVTAWLQSPTHRQRTSLAQAWREDPTWNDLFHVPTLHPEDTGAWRNDPLLAREAILRHLQACIPGTWYTLSGFVAAIKETDPDFQRPDGDYASWYIRDAATGAYLSDFESWDAVEGALVRYIVTRPLAWLGLTDLGAEGTPGSPRAHVFRLTAAGAAYLGLAEAPAEPEPGPMTLRPDFTVLVPPARRYERFQLARVADWARSGDPFVYRLTPTSLKRARRQGISVTRAIEFLGQASGGPVSHFVETALTRWDARGAEVRLEQVALLRVSDEELMKQITSLPRTRRFIGEQVGPTAAVVQRRDWTRLITALGEMGLLTDVVTPDLKENDT